MDQQSEKKEVDLAFYIDLVKGEWDKFERAIEDLAIPNKTRHNYQLLTRELIKLSKRNKELEIKCENKAQVRICQNNLSDHFLSTSCFIFNLFRFSFLGPRGDSSLRKF